MKLMYIVLFICALTFLLYACHPNQNSESFVEIDASQNSLLYISSIHKYEEITEMLSLKPSIQDMHDMVQLDYIKKTTSGYSTMFQTEKGYTLVEFNAHGQFSWQKEISFSKDISEDVMEQITIGTTLSTIRQLDPNGDYSFLYTGWSGNPFISNHYLDNGIHYTIYYDDNLCVQRIDKKVI